MKIANISEFRRNMKAYMDYVIEQEAPVIISRGEGDNIVVMSERSYNGTLETLHLLRNPKNAERLLASIAELNRGGGTIRELIEPAKVKKTAGIVLKGANLKKDRTPKSRSAAPVKAGAKNGKLVRR